MDTKKTMPEAMKAEFEAAFELMFGFGSAHVVAANDSDAAAMMGAAAWAWQASREAVVIELPAEIGDSVRECREAIEAHGLKVKP